MEIRKTFETATEAVQWVVDNSGLWAGVGVEDQHEIYDALESQGQCVFPTVGGDLLIAELATVCKVIVARSDYT